MYDVVCDVVYDELVLTIGKNNIMDKVPILGLTHWRIFFIHIFTNIYDNIILHVFITNINKK